jgi:regulator of RNase E activity RraA
MTKSEGIVMNYHSISIRYLVLSSIMVWASSASPFSLHALKSYTPSLPSFLSKKSETESVQREYPLGHNGIITVKNTTGDICIKTEWNQNKVSLNATKKAPSKEQLSHITFSDKIVGQALTIQTEQTGSKGSIDYTLIVPAKSMLNLNTDNGSILVQESNGRICATTVNGNIEINQSSDMVTVSTKKQGSIKIQQARATVQATTQKGDIIIADATESVIANTQNGKIAMKSKQVPPLSKIKLTSEFGPIELQLPSQVNADLKASAHHGTVVSQLPITLKPYTTKLDSQAWRQFKEQVSGTFGTGEAQITLNTKKGNIKILDTKTT